MKKPRTRIDNGWMQEMTFSVSHCVTIFSFFFVIFPTEIYMHSFSLRYAFILVWIFVEFDHFTVLWLSVAFFFISPWWTFVFRFFFVFFLSSVVVNFSTGQQKLFCMLTVTNFNTVYILNIEYVCTHVLEIGVKCVYGWWTNV